MTTGNRTTDTRTLNNVSACGSAGYLGRFKSKIWSGTDLPVGFDRSLPLPPHNYTVDFVEKFYTTYLYQYPSQPVQNGLHPQCFGDWAVPAFPSGPGAINLENKVIARLRDRIEGNDFDLSVFLGTEHQSLRTICDASTTLYNAYKAIRHGNVRKARRILTTRETIWHPHLDDSVQQFRKYSVPAAVRDNRTNVKDLASSKWLELQYGWLPLISDIYSASEKLAFNLYAPKQFKSHAKGKIKSSPDVVIGGNIQRYSGWYSIRYTAIHAESGTYAQRSGLTNPENLVWELLPWSFVVDWFIPIGNYLETRAFSQRATGTFVRSIMKSHKGKWVGSSCTILNDKSFVDATSIIRTVSSSLNVPTPRFVPFDQAISWRRAANAVALMVQSFK